MATLEATLGVVARQYSPTGRFAAWRRGITQAIDPGGVFSGGLVNLALAAGGEVQMSSPLGQWMLKLSKAIEDGEDVGHSSLGPVHGQVGQGGFWTWANRITT
jgi:hypothetical protein